MDSVEVGGSKWDRLLSAGKSNTRGSIPVSEFESSSASSSSIDSRIRGGSISWLLGWLLHRRATKDSMDESLSRKAKDATELRGVRDREGVPCNNDAAVSPNLS